MPRTEPAAFVIALVSVLVDLPAQTPVAAPPAAAPAPAPVTHRVLLQGDGRLAILGHRGEIEWEMPWGGIHDLYRLADGRILVQEAMTRVVAIDPAQKKVVNGHYVLGNCHAGKGQPVLIEIEPKTKAVVWTLDAFDRFGNSVSNSLLLDVQGLR